MQPLYTLNRLTFFLAFAFPITALSQAGASFACAQPETHQHRLQNDEHYRRAFEQQEALLYEQARRTIAPRGASSTYTLPVVFHIIHDNGDENITDAAVDAALQRLNKAFANTGPYNPATGVDIKISFCLARRSPEAAATTGMLRGQSPLTEFNYNDPKGPQPLEPAGIHQHLDRAGNLQQQWL